MKMNFWKMHGAQNDFVLFDNRKGDFPAEDGEFIRQLADRRTGIGADGVILIEPSASADFRMRFFNSDGGEAEMCGNGARCAVGLACGLGAADKKMTLETGAGILRAQVMRNGVRLWMTPPTGWDLDGMLEIDGRHLIYGAVNTGVPHVVLRTGELRDVDVCAVGSAIRRHRRFAPAGTNVNFMQVQPGGTLSIRTYERGVEDETGACGTGATACGLVAAKNRWAQLPVRVQVAGGDVLVVNARLTDSGARDVTLTGPAEHVFEGTVEYRRK
jgi:diaminopimelate epimerase